jgi:hypothetical protein
MIFNPTEIITQNELLEVVQKLSRERLKRVIDFARLIETSQNLRLPCASLSQDDSE